ncbi:hypothetical protein, partial [Xenorhabdus beddingii]|uniref:hypothetical protein n=1 Tax=Xenorhabdus beddingii TaxID=40578 RepID=UPI001FC944C8
GIPQENADPPDDGRADQRARWRDCAAECQCQRQIWPERDCLGYRRAGGGRRQAGQRGRPDTGRKQPGRRHPLPADPAAVPGAGR